MRDNDDCDFPFADEHKNPQFIGTITGPRARCLPSEVERIVPVERFSTLRRREIMPSA
jgi:hypothetical protein